MKTKNTNKLLVRGNNGRFTGSVVKNRNYQINLNGSYPSKYQGLDSEGNQLWLVRVPKVSE